MENIDHIIYLMLENRSLDNVLGWLYEKGSPQHFIPNGNTSPYNGLQTGHYINPNGKGGHVHAGKILSNEGQQIPSVDPHEKFEHVKTQIAKTDNIEMGGFYEDFSTVKDSIPEQIMQNYSLESLPVINSLAQQFAVSDEYFSSIPTQTNANRAFSLTGNSIGSYHDWPHEDERTAMVNDYWEKEPSDAGDPYVFTEQTIWNVLNKHKFDKPEDWMVFYSQKWPGTKLKTGYYCFTRDLFWNNLKDQTDHFKDISNFYTLAGQGKLPTFSYLEPTWCELFADKHHNGNDYHPPANNACGEKFLYDLYNELKKSPKWNNTLLIINFDEHGGTFDHVKPPVNNEKIKGTNETYKIYSPWDDTANGTKPPYDYDIKFSYEQLGVRVPLILVSPLIKGNTVIRSSNPQIPFDHTTVMATILDHFGITRLRWGLGSRTYNATAFSDVITLTPETARSNVDIKAPLSTDCTAEKDQKPNDLQLKLTYRMFSQVVKQNNLSKSKFRDLYQEHFREINTMHQLYEKTTLILDLLMGEELKSGGKEEQDPVHKKKGWLTRLLRMIYKMFLPKQH